MLKVKPHEDYPPEEGRYVRGNDYSPVAVAIVLNCDEDKMPPELEKLVRAGVESGAALAGTVQTANIGFEKMICNIVSNPTVRYLAFGVPATNSKITFRVTQPWSEPVDDNEREAREKAKELMGSLRNRIEGTTARELKLL